MATMHKYAYESGITAICFSPNPPPHTEVLAIAHKDGAVQILRLCANMFSMYSPEEPHEIGAYRHATAALCVAFTDNNILYSGGADGCVSKFEFSAGANGEVTVIGKHEGAVNCMLFHAFSNFIVSAGENGFLKIWKNALALGAPIHCGEAICAMDATEARLVVGTRRREVLIFDVTRLDAPPLAKMELGELYNSAITAIRCNELAEFFALGTDAGETILHYWNEARDGVRKHATLTGDGVSSINGLFIHPTEGTVVVGDSRGRLNVHKSPDEEEMRPIKFGADFFGPIVGVAMRAESEILAIATSEQIGPTTSITAAAATDAAVAVAADDDYLRTHRRPACSALCLFNTRRNEWKDFFQCERSWAARLANVKRILANAPPEIQRKNYWAEFVEFSIWKAAQNFDEDQLSWRFSNFQKNFGRKRKCRASISAFEMPIYSDTCELPPFVGEPHLSRVQPLFL